MKDSQKMFFENSQTKVERDIWTYTIEKSRSEIEKDINSSTREKSNTIVCIWWNTVIYRFKFSL